ncbi:hypothetical protein NUW58_g741 [Xylaria curta]|uniref:Uncharacterized protein n=1 Tax=Xylaria curta TaxID=42375 RepID=A0ACC1PN30_9PEZI|nr:hypothetical protein NUW58_g741 [Xylaria curta]
MAQTIVLQQISIPAQPEESAPASGSQAISEDASAQPLPDRMSSRQDDEASRNSSERRTEQANNAANTVPLNQGRLWSETLSRIANTCAMLALLLTVVFGATQWVAQDKSITIAKESELVSLALSFLEKYPGGPEISRRGDIHKGILTPEDDNEAELVRITLGHTAAHLAMMDQFLRNQSTRFQSALKTSDLQLPLLQIEDIIDTEKAFLQDMALLKAKLARQQAHGAGLTPRDGDRRGPQNTHAPGKKTKPHCSISRILTAFRYVQSPTEEFQALADPFGYDVKAAGPV